jgi:hypothetical protein
MALLSRVLAQIMQTALLFLRQRISLSNGMDKLERRLDHQWQVE